MSSTPRKPRYAVGAPVARFVVRRLLGRRNQGPDNRTQVWWYRIACRHCGTERDASQPVMLQAQQGRALGCAQCRAERNQWQSKWQVRRAPDTASVDAAPVVQVSASRRMPVVRPIPGSACAVWLAAMGLS